jgi:hypothetical protein
MPANICAREYLMCVSVSGRTLLPVFVSRPYKISVACLQTYSLLIIAV